MDKYEVAKELGIDLEHLEKIGKEYRKTVDNMRNTVLTHQQFIEWLEKQISKLDNNRWGKVLIVENTSELVYVKHLENELKKILGDFKSQQEILENGKGREYNGAFWVESFEYKGKRYVAIYTYKGEVYLHDVSRYGKILGIGKEKFSNITYYPEIKEEES